MGRVRTLGEMCGRTAKLNFKITRRLRRGLHTVPKK